MSYSNPLHHDAATRAPIQRAPIQRAPMTPDALAHWLERDGATCQQHLDAAAELRRLDDGLQNALRHFNDEVDAYKTMSAQRDALERERDELLRLIGRIHNNAAESPEWIRARIDETIVRLAAARAQ